MTIVHVSYYGMEGTGRTLTEAKKVAGRRIEQALSGSYTPRLLTWRGYAKLVYRQPSGWHSALIAEPETGVRTDACWGSSSDTEEEAVRAAQLDLAQLGWRPEDGLQPPPFLKDRGQADDFRHWVKFQLRYRAAGEKGLNDNDAHYYACGGLGRPELIALVEGA